MSDGVTCRDLAAPYASLHEGAAMDACVRQPIPERPRKLRVLGRLAEIQYAKVTTEKKIPTYWHPFAAHARPTIAIDERGRLWIYAGLYEVRNGWPRAGLIGICDLPRAKQRAEKLPAEPKSLIDLGRLEWIKYLPVGKSQPSKARVFSFPARTAPTLAHHNGDLWVLGGRYALSAANGDTEMKSKRSVMRANPSKSSKGGKSSNMEKGKALLLTGLTLGGGVVLTGELMDLGLTRFAPSLTGYKRGAVEVGVGLVAGGISLFAGGPKALTAGLAAGGVAWGLKTMFTAYRASRPAGLAFVPQGGALPAGYRPVMGAQGRMAAVGAR